MIGIDIKGFRQFLNIYQDRINNNRNMKRTAKIAFPDVMFVDSLTDIIPKFYKYTHEKDAKKLLANYILYTLKKL